MHLFRPGLAALSLVLLTLNPTAIAAQTTFATITGTVTDSSGAVIRGAAVTATNVETSVATKTTTNDDGVYTVAQLREGPYLLSIAAPGFREFIATDILLVTRDLRRIDAVLQTGGFEAAVKVTAGSAPIELETARVSDVRTADQLRTLPLNDPGVYSTLAITPMMSFRGGTYTFAGSKYNQSQFAIDGTSMSDGVGETPIGPLANYIESFKEVKIDLANNSAESASLGQVTIVSKSGTNRFQGAVFDYYQSPILRVKNPFSMRRASRGHPFPRSGARRSGGDSATLRRPRPHLLVRLGRDRQRQFRVVGSQPDGSARGVAAGRFLRARDSDSQPAHRRGLRGRPDSGVGVQSGGTAISRNGSIRCRTPAAPRRWSPTTTVRPWMRDRSKPYYATARLDHNFGDNDRIFGRFTFHQATNPVWEGNLPAIGMRQALRQNKARHLLVHANSGAVARSTSSDTVMPTTTIRSPDRSGASSSSTRSACAGWRPACPTSAASSRSASRERH